MTGVLTRGVAVISSGTGECSGETWVFRDGAEAGVGMSVRSVRRVQSVIAYTARGPFIGPKKAASADASSSDPTRATSKRPTNGSHRQETSFHAYNVAEATRPFRPRTSRNRFATMPPTAIPIESRSSVSTYIYSRSSAALRPAGYAAGAVQVPPATALLFLSGRIA